MADTQGVECHAPAGSLIFWHACTLHGAGINVVPGTIRQSVIYDFHLTTAATNALSALLKQWPVEREWSNEVEAEAATLWAGWAEPQLAAEQGCPSTEDRAARL